MRKRSPAALVVSWLVALLPALAYPSSAAGSGDSGAWRREGAPIFTQRERTEDCNYFGSRLILNDGSATGSVSWKDCSVQSGPNQCSGTYQGSVTWTRPPEVLQPGDRIPFTGTAKTSARNSCGYRNIGSGVTIWINRSSLLDVIERLAPSATGEFAVPRGTSGATLVIEVGVKAAGNDGRVTYNYVYDSSPEPSPPREPAPEPKDPPRDPPKKPKHGTGTQPPPGKKVPPGFIALPPLPVNRSPLCVWTTLAFDPRSFATQPGGVLPLRTPFAPGEYQIHVGPAGRDGLALPPARIVTFGPRRLEGGHKYLAIPRDEGRTLWWRGDDDPRLTQYGRPPADESRVYSRNEASQDTWYAICLTPVAGSGESEPAHGAPTMIFSNFNDGGVLERPVRATSFTLERPTYISVIRTYHWNGQRGAPPGEIRLRDAAGKLYGPWNAIGVIGPLGVRNAYWVVSPNLTLPAGTYVIHDSDPATWSQNAASGGRGFSQVEGRVGAAP